jgi:hypothetical protein
MRRIAYRLAVAVAVVTTASRVWAQPGASPAGRPLVGVVRDAAGAAVERVTVTVNGASVLTDVRGGFRLVTGDVDTVTISLRHVGYEPIEARLMARNRQWDTVMVQLDAVAQRLSRLNVNESLTRSALGLRNFEKRRASGIGTFITREQIVARGSSRLSDLLRTTRGVNVVRGKVRFAAYNAGSRTTSCQPDIWLDGTRSQGMEIDELPSNTVEAMELYPYFSSIPIEFQRVGANTTPCGTIVVWTRIPNGRQP